MSHRPTLADFVDQELRLSDATFAAATDAVLKQWRERAPGRWASDAEALRLLHLQRDDFIRRAVQSLQEQTMGRASVAGAAAPKSTKLELSLVDDDEITADIEIARIVERSNADLEEPLRELRTYTSALVGDVNTARDTNPLRPEVWVRALLAAARTLPIAPNLQIELLRTAMHPLIRALNDNYAAACSRLHALGVTPAAHRTVVNEGVVTELTDAMRARRSLDREAEEGALPGSVEDLLYRVEQGLLSAAPHGGERSAAGPRDEQPTVERLSNLYDAILSDRRLPRESLPLLSRLYPAVLRQTLADASVLGDARHPVWQFMDQLGFLMQTREVGDRQVNIAFAQGLIEQLVAQHGADARSFQSAANRLIVLERQRFARAVSAAAAEIAMLTARTHEGAFGATTSLPQALDPGSSDTLQAPLRRDGDAATESDDVVSAWRAGSWLSIFLRQQWRRALILWRAPSRGPLLLLDASASRHWALRSAAIERLADEGLARVFSPRSLIRDAGSRIGQVARDPGPTLFG
ncbi:MAG TPA: DUF1631 family protein [Burkholderiaceae bacterium]|nr:DUF1631 family protein [Burkholderiaceae bacterium]